MKLQKAIDRERKLRKRRTGHKEDGRSVKYLLEIQKDKSAEIKRLRKLKEEFLEKDE